MRSYELRATSFELCLLRTRSSQLVAGSSLGLPQLGEDVAFFKDDDVDAVDGQFGTAVFAE